jgi:hypothetical protein
VVIKDIEAQEIQVHLDLEVYWEELGHTGYNLGQVGGFAQRAGFTPYSQLGQNFSALKGLPGQVARIPTNIYRFHNFTRTVWWFYTYTTCRGSKGKYFRYFKKTKS